VAQGQKSSIQKIGGYTVSLNHKIHFRCWKVIKEALYIGYDQLLQDQINAWAKFGKCQTSLLEM
jgi:maltose phosphorylase